MTLVPDDADGSPANPDYVLGGKIVDLPLALTGKIVPSLDDLVNQWKTADKATESLAWLKADICAEAETIDGGLSALAEAVNVNYQTVKNYRYVAHQWPKGGTARAVPFKVAERLAAQPDRFELAKSKKWTVREAAALVRERRAAQQALGASSCVAGVIPLIPSFHGPYVAVRAISGDSSGSWPHGAMQAHLRFRCIGGVSRT